jgi:hypothetical protein
MPPKKTAAPKAEAKQPKAEARKNDERLTATALSAQPEFDLFTYCELSGETRLEHDLLEEIEPRFDDWQRHLKAYRLSTGGEKDPGYVILWLEKPVEDEVEGIWQDSPSAGMAFHNLAIHMVMSAVQNLVPELADRGCAPLPKPDKAVIAAFKKLGLTWNKEGTVDRQFAVFTNMPAIASCGTCMLKAKCESPAKD